MSKADFISTLNDPNKIQFEPIPTIECVSIYPQSERRICEQDFIYEFPFTVRSHKGVVNLDLHTVFVKKLSRSTIDGLQEQLEKLSDSIRFLPDDGMIHNIILDKLIKVNNHMNANYGDYNVCYVKWDSIKNQTN